MHARCVVCWLFRPKAQLSGAMLTLMQVNLLFRKTLSVISGSTVRIFRGFVVFFFIILPAPHKFEVQSLTMNKEGALIGRSPSISIAVVTIARGLVRVMHVHQGRLWGQVIPQVG